MASGGDDLGEASVGPKTRRVHDWVPEGMELRFAFLVNIRRERFIVDAKDQKKFQGGFDYRLPMDCNLRFRQFGEVICGPYPWGLHDEVEFKYYDGGSDWVKVSNDGELATMFAKHKEKGQFHNLRRPCRAENRDEADNDAFVIDDEEGEDEDLPPIEWDPENPRMEEGSIFASMSECRNALVTYCIKAERTFEVDKSDTVRYRVHCPTEDCPWRMHASKMRNITNVQVKVNPFRHTCLESTLRKETISRAKSRWVAEEVKRWVTENHQVGTKELQKKLKEKFKIEVPYMRVFNGKQHAMDSIYGQAGNIQQYVHDYYSVAKFKATYAHALPALEGKQQWDIVDPGFKLCPPVLKRAAGRPRKSRIRRRSEGAGLGPRRRKCTRCGGSGHFAKYCDNAVDPTFRECFDAPNDEQNDDQNEDPMEATSDDQIDDPIEAPNDEQIEDPIVAPIDDPIEASNDEQQNDQNDDPIEASNDEQIEAPNVGVQLSVVVSSTWYVNLANTSVHLSLDTILPPCPFVLYNSVVGSNKVVAVSSEVVKVLTTKWRRKEAMSTRITRSKVVAMSTRITRSKVVAM
ncbi:hypothetical protein ACQ4PT_030919 [Festuca glaucescens]